MTVVAPPAPPGRGPSVRETSVRGTARVGRLTKQLVKRLQPGDIAVIAHRDLDAVAAESLRAARPLAVVNGESSISGRYPNEGPRLLLEAGVPVLDEVGADVVDRVVDGAPLEIRGSAVFQGQRFIGRGRWLTMAEYERRAGWGEANLRDEIRRFVDNTLAYAAREKDGLLGDLALPPLRTPLRGRHALVVVRGRGYRDDLAAVAPYVRDVKPVLIGVDGGADALWEHGFRPHIIVGDMDSVSDGVLAKGAELVVHAYPDGRAPGLERLRRLGLAAHVVSLPGTSEDLALLLAAEGGADLIVAVGSHTHPIEFFEKDRAGMASTFLTRLRVGPLLVDAKGVSRLYRTAPKAHHSAVLAAAAALPLLLALAASEGLRVWLRLAWLHARLWLGL